MNPSLLDLSAGGEWVNWYVTYHHREPHYWWSRMMEPGFRHVNLVRPYYYGPGDRDVMWLQIRPVFEMMLADIDMDPRSPWEKDPTCTVQNVSVLRKPFGMREWFFAGPPTCVEVVKAALGISSFWIRTPHQLYKYLAKRGGVLK